MSGQIVAASWYSTPTGVLYQAHAERIALHIIAPAQSSSTLDALVENVIVDELERLRAAKMLHRLRHHALERGEVLDAFTWRVRSILDARHGLNITINVNARDYTNIRTNVPRDRSE